MARLPTKEIVHSYMLDHNFTRPPTIGEEHEASPLDRMSNHSSVSGKSEVSTATPRRADGELGFNPEGSASPFPSYERWKLSLHNVLEDTDGLNVFKRFLEESKLECILECWLAMKGFKNFGLKSSSAASSTTGSTSSRNQVVMAMDIETTERRCKLAKTIYKKFLSKTAMNAVSSIIKGPTKSYIGQHIKMACKNSRGLDSDLFHQAQTEIELNMEAELYTKFLNSENFAQYSNQYDSLSPKAGNTPHQQPQQSLAEKKEPSTANPASLDNAHVIPPDSRYLPAINEHGEWKNDQSKRSDMMKMAIEQSRKQRLKDGDISIYDRDQQSAALPYYTPNTYWVPPASAIGSDQASKSSDATSDTLSCSDKSFEGLATHHRSSSSKRFIKAQVIRNPNTLPDCCHVPLTSRCRDIPLLAEKDPEAFFMQLKVKLDQVIEERRKEAFRARAERQKKAAAMEAMKENEEDNDQILESHLARVRALQSPGGRCSPPNPAGFQRMGPGANNAYYRNPGYAVAGHAGPQPLPGRAKAEKLDVGFVPGMPQNEVPDIATPVVPVDKNQMIKAWIQTPQAYSRNKRTMKKGRYTAPDIETVPEDMPFVHPVQNTGLTVASNYQRRGMQPLAQDPTMPILDQPDASTTIQEVKRRLIAETDGSYDAASNLASLDLYPGAGSAMQPLGPAGNDTTSFSSDDHQLPGRDTHSDTDSSTETATFSNTTNVTKPAHQQSDYTTTVVYYLPNESIAYKVRLPHAPLTLGQFKAKLPTKWHACRFYFKKFSQSINKSTFFEYTKDDEALPLHDDVVLAKLKMAEPC